MNRLTINKIFLLYGVLIVSTLHAVRQPVHHVVENSLDNNASLPLHKAILLADTMYAKQVNDSIKLLLANEQVNIDEQDSNGKTPLHCAVQINDYDAIKQLLDAGANIQIKDKQGQTALSYVAGDADIYQLFALQTAYHNGVYNK